MPKRLARPRSPVIGHRPGKMANVCLAGKKAEWRVLATPMYVLRSDEFRRNAEDLVKSAKEKNLDAAALAYVQLTMSCVNCHKHVRETRIARLDER